VDNSRRESNAHASCPQSLRDRGPFAGGALRTTLRPLAYGPCSGVTLFDLPAASAAYRNSALTRIGRRFASRVTSASRAAEERFCKKRRQSKSIEADWSNSRLHARKARWYGATTLPTRKGMRQEDATAAVRPTARKRAQPDLGELVQTSFRLPRSRWRNLRDLSLDERTSVQSIIVQALEAEFARRGHPF